MLVASLPRPGSGAGVWSSSASIAGSAQWLGGDVGLHLAQDVGRLGALQALDVVLVLEQNAQRVVDALGIEVERIELRQCGRPVDRFSDTRRLEEVELAQFLDEAHDLARQTLADAGRLHLQDLELALEVRIVDPMVEAATRSEEHTS